MTVLAFTPSPVNLSAGIWREDDVAARCAIRAAYRRQRRYLGDDGSRTQARLAARSVAVALADYRQRSKL